MFSLLLLTAKSEAQQLDSTAVFGYQMPKIDPTAKPKWKPTYYRLGVTGGAFVPLNGTESEGFSGLRGELGLTRRLSIVADARLGGGRDSANISPQGGLSVRYAFNNVARWQLYGGLGWGVGGSDGDGDGRGKYKRDSLKTHFDNDSLEMSENNNFHHFVTAHLGVNYLLARRVILHAELQYQMPISGTLPTNNYGSLMAQVGVAYQFGKKR